MSRIHGGLYCHLGGTVTDEGEDAGVSWSLLDGRLTMTIIPREGSDLQIQVREKDFGVVWSDDYNRGFWESRIKKGEIKNRLIEESVYGGTQLKRGLTDVWVDLIENTEEYESLRISPVVERLIENTKRVESINGDERERHVYINRKQYGTPVGGTEDDKEPETRKLVFSSSEWVRKTGGTQNPPVVKKYCDEFGGVLDISWWEWRNEVRPRWQEMQVIMPSE